MTHLQNIKHAQFVQNVLGINLTLDQTCSLMEGSIPYSLEKQILTETAIYEGFLDDLAAKIGGVPKAVAKTFTDATGVLTFIYNVISDKTGQNLQKGITIILRNSKALFAQIDRLASQLSGKLKEIFDKIMDWMKSKVKTITSIQSDTDSEDGLKGEGANWKKFILLFLVGMVLIFLRNIPSMLKEFGEDVVKGGLEKIWDLSQDLITKFFSSPADLLKLVSGSALVKILLPLIAVYRSAKMLQSINADLLDSNAWLRKSPA